jgi:hypothetical protein
MIKKGFSGRIEDFVSSFVAGEAIAAGDAVSLIIVADSGLTAGRIYKSSAATLNQKMNFKGFALEAAASAGTTIKVATHTIFDGLSGLTAETDYYLSNTAGLISATPGTYKRWVGRANASTRIDRMLGIKRVVSPPFDVVSPAPFDCFFQVSANSSIGGPVAINGVSIISDTSARTGGGMAQAGDTLDASVGAGAYVRQITALQ